MTAGVCRRKKDREGVVVVVLGVRRLFFFFSSFLHKGKERVFGMAIKRVFLCIFFFCSRR